jgi:hypothetical protein
MHPAALPDEALLDACRETRTKRGGPGGQHRNKTETAVVLVHVPTGIVSEASERRSQHENRGVALKRLRLRLALEHRSQSKPSAPSALWRSRSRGRRLVISVEHGEYSALLAEALDHLQAAGADASVAAESLGVSTTQLVRLFQKSPAAWVAFNSLRAACGLLPLK